MPQNNQPADPAISRAIACVHMSASRQAVLYVDTKGIIQYEMWAASSWGKYESFHRLVQEELDGEIYTSVPFVYTDELPQADERTVFRLYSHFVGADLKKVLHQLKKICEMEDPWQSLPPVFFEKDYQEMVWYSADCFYYANTEGKLAGVPMLLLSESSIEAPPSKEIRDAMLTRWRTQVPENPKFIRTSTVTKSMNRLLGHHISEIDQEIKTAVGGYYHPKPKCYENEEWWNYSREHLEGFVVAYIFEVISPTEFEIVLHTKSWDYEKRKTFIDANLKKIIKLAIDELKRRPNTLKQIENLSFYKISHITMTLDCTIEILFAISNPTGKAELRPSQL